MAKQNNNIFSEFFGWLIKPIDWPQDLYVALTEFLTVRQLSKEPGILKLFKKNKPELRFDKIFRIYTVINIPEEMYPKEFENSRQTYLIDELRKLEELFLKVGISEIVYPRFELITDVKDAFAYLLVLDTNKESLSIIESLKYIAKLAIYYLIILSINAIVLNTTGSSIIEHITSIL
tara:strand:+ start:325 stop:855 length:531 start_codon:yes stop_codon:yes gene_type:complete